MKIAFVENENAATEKGTAGQLKEIDEDKQRWQTFNSSSVRFLTQIIKLKNKRKYFAHKQQAIVRNSIELIDV